MRGQRVQAVVGELQGEKVDIIQWNQDAATFIVNALAPAEVTKVVLDEESNRIEVVVPESQLSLAIGRRGQNVRLASQLTGWDIDILTEQEESERRQKEFAERTQLFMEALDVDEVIAQLLATEGFETVTEVAYVDSSEIAHIEGFDEDTAKEIQARAREYLERQEAERERQFSEYKDRVGEICNGTVKRVEYGNVIVDLGRAEGIVRRDEMIPRENVRLGDRLRAYIYDVRREQRGPQIFLSRARPEFMSKLFAQEVPEIYDGIVQIKSVARDPGSRA